MLIRACEIGDDDDDVLKSFQNTKPLPSAYPQWFGLITLANESCSKKQAPKIKSSSKKRHPKLLFFAISSTLDGW